MDFDVNFFREKVKIIAPHINFESKYNFYYDETNNIRKLYVKEEDFNASIESNFVLGGVIDNEELVEFLPFIESLKLQPSVKEIKFKHIANGNFLNCLKSNKLKLFFEFLLDWEIDVHFSSVNTLYFSIVDIVDSIVVNFPEIIEHGLVFIFDLKDALYQIARMEIKGFKKLFFVYKYPNIQNKDLISFIAGLVNILEPYKNNKDFGKIVNILSLSLNKSKELEKLPFLQDETDLLLLKDFSQFYLRPLYLFINSRHVFDKENQIESELSKFNLIYNKEKLDHYTFEISEENIFIQLSDVFVGICGKMSKFINCNTIEEIQVVYEGLNQMQKDNLKLIFKTITKSRNKNPGFVHWTSAISEIKKTEYLEDLVLS